MLSLGPQHSFPLEDVFDFLAPGDGAGRAGPGAARRRPMFRARWRWNVTRSLAARRASRTGRRVPTPLQRMRADDLLDAGVPAGPRVPRDAGARATVEVPLEHPLVRQTVEDCLTEAMDVRRASSRCCEGLRSGRIERVARRRPRAVGVRARGALRQAVRASSTTRRSRSAARRRCSRARVVDDRVADTHRRARRRAPSRACKAEAWPDPRDAEEVARGAALDGVRRRTREARGVGRGSRHSRRAGRVVREGERWFAAEATRDPKEVLRGRLEALGPVVASAEGRTTRLLRALEAEGASCACASAGRDAWCERRLLARIQRYTLDRLRREIEPVTAADFLRFLAALAARGRAAAASRARAASPRSSGSSPGFEAPAAAWESRDPARARARLPQREWLDQLDARAARSRGDGCGAPARPPIRSTPIALFPREDLDLWLGLAPAPTDRRTSTAPPRRRSRRSATRGALFPQEIGAPRAAAPLLRRAGARRTSSRAGSSRATRSRACAS